MSEPIRIEDDLMLTIHDGLLVEHGHAEGARVESLLRSRLPDKSILSLRVNRAKTMGLNLARLEIRLKLSNPDNFNWNPTSREKSSNVVIGRRERICGVPMISLDACLE